MKPAGLPRRGRPVALPAGPVSLRVWPVSLPPALSLALLSLLIPLTLTSCGADPPRPVNAVEPMDAKRTLMVERQLRGRDIDNANVLAAMRKVPRHQFVPEHLQAAAYEDRPLLIGHDQTISQPYIVALMTQLADPTTQSRVLDVGTGSGYQAAVLAELVDHVYSIEIVEPLATAAKNRLQSLGYDNVTVRHGDGYQGWPEQAPFDAIIVAAAPDHVPQPLIDQLAIGGRLILPVGKQFGQTLLLIEKQADGGIRRTGVAPVAFVPLTRSSDQVDEAPPQD